MKRLLVLLVVAGHALTNLCAREILSVSSTYLGDGWFSYTTHTLDDPFFLFFDQTGFSLNDSGGLEQGPNPPGWTNASPQSVGSWYFTGSGLGDQVRPYAASFLVHSSETSFKRAHPGAVLLMSLSMVEGYHGNLASANIVGYWNLDVLVPCPPEQADGSSTNLIVSLPNALPDIQISGLILTNGRPFGISYDYPEENTVRLQGTRDFNAWTRIAYIYGSAGTTAWITNQPLDGFGNYFQVQLVAEGHATNLPPLNVDSASFAATVPISRSVAAPTGQTTSAPRLLSVRPYIEGVQLALATTAGRNYSVSLLDKTGSATVTVEVLATGATTNVRLPCAGPDSGLLLLQEVSP
jgi:hypothetical protein